MENNYTVNAKKFKALSDANRLRIIDLLSEGEKCAGDILESFDFTQSTLSHHMKVLMECELVKCRKEGLWSHYSLDNNSMNIQLFSLINFGAETTV